MKKAIPIFLLMLAFHLISTEAIQSQEPNVKMLGGPGTAILDSWSPDGSRLAIHSSYELSLYDDELDEVETILLRGITNVKWGNSSKFLAFTYTIAEGQNRAVIWDVESESIYMELGDNLQYAWHPSEDFITIYQNKHASLIDVTTADETQTFTFDSDQAITDVYWGADSQQILFAVSGNDDTSYQLRDLETGEVLDTFTPSRVEGEFFDIVWSSETRQFLRYSANDREIEVMDIATSEIVNTFPVVDHARFSFDKRHLRVAYVKDDHAIVVIDLTSGDSIVLNGHTDAVGELAWNSDHYLATSGDDGRVTIWDILSGDIVFEYTINSDVDMAWHPNGNLLAVVSGYSSMSLIDLRRGTISGAGNHFSTDIETMNWSQDGNYIVVSISDNDRETLTKVWDAWSGELVDITAQQWTPDYPIQNDSIFSLGHEGLDKNLIYWDRQGQEYLINGEDGVERWNASENRQVTQYDDVCMYAASSTLDYIATCQNQILELSNNQIIVEQDPSLTPGFGFHPEQNLYAMLDFSGNSVTRTIEIIDLASGSSTSTIELPVPDFEPESSVWSIAEYGWNREGNLIWIMRSLPTSPIAARSFVVVDVEQRQVLASGEYFMYWSRIHPSEAIIAGILDYEIVDGLVRIAEGNIVQIRDMLTQEVLYEYALEEFSVLGIRWSPDGGQLAIADSSGRVHIWDYDG